MCFIQKPLWICFIFHFFQLFEILWITYQQVFHKTKIVEKCGKI